jgi:hypothetical protein
MKSVALVVTLMATCFLCTAQESLSEQAKEYYMTVLHGNGQKETTDYTWAASELYGYTIRQLRESTVFQQEGKSFEDSFNEVLAFELKKRRYFRAVLLVALAGDLGFRPVVKDSNIQDYLKARRCSSCRSWWIGPRAVFCCRCKNKGPSNYVCVLKEGHDGKHNYDLSVVLGPMPSERELQMIPYGK